MVRNLALVDQIALDFGPGLNVLTGETGAGKSVLVGALSLILGARAQSDVVRTGASEAVVEALFDGLEPRTVERLAEAGVPVDDGQLLVRRVVSKAGRSRVQINGQLATVSMLARVMRGVLDITSQHEHVGLLDPASHLDAVDGFGQLEKERAAVARVYGRVRAQEATLAELAADEATREVRAEALRRSLSAIDEAAPQPGELEALDAEHRRLRHQGALSEGLRSADDLLYSGDGAVVESVGQVLRTLERMAEFDDALTPFVDALTSAVAELDDVAHGVARYRGRLAADPGRLDAVEDRLQCLRGLAKRYGGDLEGVLAAHRSMAEELECLEQGQARTEALEAELAKVRAVLASAAEALSAHRRKVVGPLAAAVQQELVDLSMAKTRIEVRLVPVDPPGPTGAETAELLISPNPGEPLRPLRRIASGGEMSRLLLALKNVLRKHQSTTYVFDEIDTGIGGAIAEVLGAKLRTVARSAQVIAVTHLPQVAAFADTHFHVEKALHGRRTVTEVTRLNAADQVAELARMLGGLKITRATRSLAREMRSRAVGEVPAGRRRAVAVASGR